MNPACVIAACIASEFPTFLLDPKSTAASARSPPYGDAGTESAKPAKLADDDIGTAQALTQGERIGGKVEAVADEHTQKGTSPPRTQLRPYQTSNEPAQSRSPEICGYETRDRYTLSLGEPGIQYDERDEQQRESNRHDYCHVEPPTYVGRDRGTKRHSYSSECYSVTSAFNIQPRPAAEPYTNRYLARATNPATARASFERLQTRPIDAKIAELRVTMLLQYAVSPSVACGLR